MLSALFRFLPHCTMLLLLPLHASTLSTAPSPNLVPLLNGTIDIGKPLAPIPIPGGVRLVEPITGGVFSSATLNATVFGGEAYPALYNNQTVQVAEIRIYGNTSDDVPFFIQEAGVGAPTAQFTRIQLEIGGKYAALSNAFIIASVAPNKARTQAMVQAFVIEQS